MSTQSRSGKQWVWWLFLILGVGLIINLSRGVWGLYKARDRIKQADAKVDRLEGEKQLLDEQLKYQLSEGYAEKEIREKLNMAKPGERVVILPELTETPAVSVTPGKDDGIDLNEPIDPVWMRWVKLFL